MTTRGMTECECGRKRKAGEGGNFKKHLDTCPVRPLILKLREAEGVIQCQQDEITSLKRRLGDDYLDVEKVRSELRQEVHSEVQALFKQYTGSEVPKKEHQDAYAFGNEPLESLPATETVKGLLSNPQTSLISFIKLRRTDAKVHNIRITNARENVIQVFDGKRWCKQPKRETLVKYLESNLRLLMNHYHFKEDADWLEWYVDSWACMLTEEEDVWTFDDLIKWDDGRFTKPIADLSVLLDK